MAECLARAVRQALPEGAEISAFSNAIQAMAALQDGLPQLILLDILLDGPDGFTFLNELMSYTDTARIPVLLVTSLELAADPLADYGVVAVLHKDSMTPPEIIQSVRQALEMNHV